MVSIVATIRKIDKQEYKFYFNFPEYEGEKGCLGIELSPYISVETPENGLGYTDTILFSYGKGYSVWDRYLAPWKMRKIESIYNKLAQKYNIEN